MDIAQAIYGFAGEADIILYVCVFIFVIFGLGLFNFIPRPTASSLMISIGIGGTFVGIFVAMHPLDFDQDKIQDSIKSLLDGMTTAFVTSLIGIFAAIVFRLIVSINIRPWRPAQSLEHKDISGKLDEIKKAIVGDADSSMVSQMRALRDENRTAFERLDSKMSGLAEAIREGLVDSLATLIQDIRTIIADQLGESLQNLINSIETALIQQFGTTFVQFNEAVQAIKKWQEEHKEHVQMLTDAFDKSAKGVSAIEEKTRAIPESMEKLDGIIATANQQVRELSDLLGTFANMRESAAEAFPTIKSHLDEINTALADGAGNMRNLQNSIGMIEEQIKTETSQMINRLNGEVDRMFNGMRNTMDSAQRAAVDEIQKMVASSINEMRQEINSEFRRVASQWADNLVSVAKECARQIEEVRAIQRR